MNTVTEDLCVWFFFAAGVLMMMEKLWTALICWQRSVPCFSSFPVHHIIMIIMEICKASNMWLKALNKPSISHIMHMEMENVIRKKERKNTHT